MTWIPLHLHSQYSILDSTASISALIERSKAFSLPALALTDFCNMHGAVDFFKACKKEGIKPLIGCELMVAPFSRHDKKRIADHAVGYPLIFLAKNKRGYQNLCKLSSAGYLEGFYYTPRVDKELLERHAEGLICLSGPLQSRLSQFIVQGREEELKEELEWCQRVYGENFYFELQRLEMSSQAIAAEGMEQESWLHQLHLDWVKNERLACQRLCALSKERDIPLVATNPIHYIEREDWRAHEILMNVQSGESIEIVERDSYGNERAREPNPRRKVMPTHELYFKSPAEMEALFADLPEALAESGRIAERCDLELDFETKYYPVFVPPQLEGKHFTEEERKEASSHFLRKLCEEGIPKRYTSERLAKIQEKYPDRDPLEVVKERLEQELSIIIPKGMGDYLLIVYDFIAWAKRSGIPMGPGRGSGVGSITLYLIGITDIEPLRFDLFFERFINPERLSYPDIDVDICMERRGEVIDYTLKRYGKDKVAQIITFGTMKAKMAIKDVGRVLNIPLKKVNEIAKLVPEDPNMTLKKAFELDPELLRLKERDVEAARVLEYAERVEGSIRNTGVHAAGLIICGDPLSDHIPVCNAKDSEMMLTQYAMKPVEAVGMLKIDFLGLKTLTSIQKAVDALPKPLDWVNLPLDNQKAFDLLNEGKAQGIFQMESSGMQELARLLHIDRFEELLAVTSLYRPGPMEMIPSFIARKHGREKIEVDHPLMEASIRDTYGIMVYQEQVMQIASRLAGYSLGEGDVLRRAMGKKDQKEMARQREKFRSGALEKGIDQKKSMEIFDKIEKFASYGFNKSHAAAYGYLSYVTAYLKANHPQEWLSALMTCDRDDVAKVSKHIRESKSLGIAVLPPNINESGREFTPTPSGIRFALTAIRGVGHGVVDAIIAEREKGGAYASLYDFFKRVDLTKVGKKLAENLVQAGSFDFTQWSRQQLLESIEPQFEEALRKQKEEAKGVLDLFSMLEEEGSSPFATPPQVKREQLQREILAKERELLGFYITGHPMEEYRPLIEKLGARPLHDLHQCAGGSAIKFACIVESAKIKISKKSQKKFAILTISDGGDHFELPLWANMYEEHQALCQESQLLFVIAQVEREEDSLRLRCCLIENLATVKEEDEARFAALIQQIERLERSDFKKQKGGFMKQKEEERSVELQVDVDKIRLSEIVTLKKLLQKYPGSAPLSIAFHSKEQQVARVEVESKWGVTWSDEIEEALRQLPFIHAFSFEG